VKIRRERETLSESIILSTVYFYLLRNCVASRDVTIFQEYIGTATASETSMLNEM